MAWLQCVRRKDGTFSYWIRDRRNGRAIVVGGGATKQEALSRLEQYEVRRRLETEGYDDQYAVDPEARR